MRPEVAQESHMPVAAICVTVVADLVGSGALEDVIRVVGVAELALILPYVTGADEIMAHGDVHQKIGLSHADAEIGRLPSCNHLIQNLQHEHYLISLIMGVGIFENILHACTPWSTRRPG